MNLIACMWNVDWTEWRVLQRHLNDLLTWANELNWCLFLLLFLRPPPIDLFSFHIIDYHKLRLAHKHTLALIVGGWVTRFVCLCSRWFGETHSDHSTNHLEMCFLTWAMQMMMAFRKFKPMDFALYRLRREKTMFACECVRAYVYICIYLWSLFMNANILPAQLCSPMATVTWNCSSVTSTRILLFLFCFSFILLVVVGFVINFQKITWSDGFDQKQALFQTRHFLKCQICKACKNHTHHPFLVVDTHIYLFLFFSSSLFALCTANVLHMAKRSASFIRINWIVFH